MVLTVDEDSQQLTDLLWVREAWGLRPAGADLPPLLVDTPALVGAPADRAGWEQAWARLWPAAVAHIADRDDRASFARLSGTADGSPERAVLLSEIFGPSWRGDVGDDAFGDGHREWARRQFDAGTRARARDLTESPEHRSLDALVPAWRAGLRKVISIPCGGDHVRRVGEHGLLVSAEVRLAPDRYAAALHAFTGR
ncbi:hypothetical protein ACIQLJ_05025 [Microbacterium sp. NPDC091313]